VRYRVVAAEQVTWTTRPHAPDEPARHTAELSELAGFIHTRANLWCYEPGARGRRHVHADQEETFVVLDGILTMYLGEPPQRLAGPRRLLRLDEREPPTLLISCLLRTTSGRQRHRRPLAHRLQKRA
jgi:hypothetical protein